ncbi:hypothetical protein [Silvibacterium dinghuense]|uniref:hypothetical protein n=1 Tax=Silvibacterium dinghuense TaxID=1560006 RepID=UPI0013E94F2E|nr:hypothetical protein [Silvibacterium dinghuense]GGH06950.1 hypothetical protein GCM10011586_23930 [Silvibacterium dinghuense]
MPYPHDEAKLKQWEVQLSDEIAKNPAPWNSYDAQLQLVTNTYNKFLSGTANYQPIDWQVIKAITWVESGAANAAWQTAPMQIGVNGDPGLRELLTSPTGKLVLPPEYANMLTVSNVPVNGNLNIEAGVGYVLKITAMFGLQADPPPAPAATPAAPASGAAPAAPPVAPAPVTPAPASAAHKSAPAAHGKSHHPKHPAPPKVHKHLAIIGWRPRTLQFIAKHYNAGDGNYADKLQFALDIITGKIKPERAPAPPPKHPAKKHTPMRVPAHGRK